MSFVSDGTPWIWNRLDGVVPRAGLDSKRVERLWDGCHAAHHISLALQALGLPEKERTEKYRTLRHQLRAGRSREVVATLRTMAEGQPADSGVWTEIEYLNKHEAHRRYDWFGYRGRPRGSGAVESAIRRVINLRLKGNGISWREENAEAMLVLRAAALTGRWQETMERTQAAMATDRRRDWQWKAPDIEAELNSGRTIKPPSSQPESLEQAEASRSLTLFGNPPFPTQAPIFRHLMQTLENIQRPDTGLETRRKSRCRMLLTGLHLRKICQRKSFPGNNLQHLQKISAF